MRRLWPLLAMVVAAPAQADTLDCALIKTTLRPFELALDWSGTAPGKEPLAVQMRRQVNRKADETVDYEMFTPEKFVRRRVNANRFLTEVFNSAAGAPVFVTYSIDVTKDYFGLGKPFDFHQIVKGADGAVVSDLDTSVTFEGAVDVELEGCAYSLTKIVETSHGSIRGAAGSDRAEIWYSRDLRTPLYTRHEDGEGSVIELRARGLSTSFKPVE